MTELPAGTDLNAPSEPGIYRYPTSTPSLEVLPGWAIVSKPPDSDTITWHIFDEHGRLITTWHRIDGKWIEEAEPLVHGTHTLISQLEEHLDR